MKSLVLAAALLLPTIAIAQDAAAPVAAPPVAQAPKPKPPRPPAAPKVVKPAQTTPDMLEITQIIAIRQVDPATYEIDARLQSGGEIHIRMNAFVMQSLGMKLGTYGKQPGG